MDEVAHIVTLYVGSDERTNAFLKHGWKLLSVIQQSADHESTGYLVLGADKNVYASWPEAKIDEYLNELTRQEGGLSF